MPIMAANTGLTLDQETKIVLLLARGDTREEIQAQMDFHVSKQTISAVKKRNKDNLQLIATKVAEKAAEDAASIKQKANTLIAKRLDKVDDTFEILDKARQDWLDDKITWKEYEKIQRRYKEVSLGELVNVSKEMHAQSNSGDTPPASPKDLAELAAAIASGDEVRITQATFNPKSNTNAEPTNV